MLEKLRLVEERYMEMAERAGQPDFYADPKAASKLLREQKRLEPIVTAYRSFCKAKKEADELREMLDAGGLDAEMKALCQEEYTALKKQLEELEQELKILLLPRDPNDDKSVIVKFAAAWAARKARFLPTACTGCIPCTRSRRAGR